MCLSVRIAYALVGGACLFLTVSCFDDPELKAQREQQRQRILAVNAEISLMKEDLKVNLPDVAEEIRNAEAEAAEISVLAAELEAELSSLAVKREALEKDFQTYQKTQPLGKR